MSSPPSSPPHYNADDDDDEFADSNVDEEVSSPSSPPPPLSQFSPTKDQIKDEDKGEEAQDETIAADLEFFSPCVQTPPRTTTARKSRKFNGNYDCDDGVGENIQFIDDDEDAVEGKAEVDSERDNENFSPVSPSPSPSQSQPMMNEDIEITVAYVELVQTSLPTHDSLLLPSFTKSNTSYEDDDHPIPIPPQTLLSTLSSLTPTNMCKAYSKMVQSNRQSFRLFENLISSIGYLLPSRFDDGEIGVEATLALSSLLSLLNDSISYGCGDGNGLTIGTSQPASTNAKTIVYLRALIASIECVELAAEKYAAMKGDGYASRRKTITRIEGVKAICRVVILYLVSTESENENGGILQNGGGLVPGEQCFTHAVGNSGVEYIGKRTGKVLRIPANLLNSPPPAKPSPTSSPNRLLVVGELLHILRPYTGVRMQNSLGEASAMAWFVQLTMDLLSHKLTTAALPEQQTTDRTPTAAELKHRKLRWLLYMLRQPIFGKVFGPGVEKSVGKFPNWLGGFVMRYVMNWLVYVKKHHFMLESGL